MPSPAGDDDGWTTIGKPRVKASGAAAAPQNSRPPILAQNDEPSTSLPGWGAPADALSGHSQQDGTFETMSKRKQRKEKFRPRTDDEIAESLSSQLQGVKGEVQRHPFFGGFQAALDSALRASCTAAESAQALASIDRMLILGLGSPESSNVARHQLALGLILRDQITAAKSTQPSARPLTVETFDPVYSPADAILMQKHLGVHVLTENTQGRFPYTEPTLFYLPHCEGWLCENLLDSMLDEGRAMTRLAPCLLIGNSFSCYQDQWEMFGKKKGRPKPEHMLHLMETRLVNEFSVAERGYPVLSAFNELGVHSFNRAGAS